MKPTTKRALGWILCALPFLAIFVTIAATSGLDMLLQVLAFLVIVGALTVGFVGGVRLILEAKHDEAERKKALRLQAERDLTVQARTMQGNTSVVWDE